MAQACRGRGISELLKESLEAAKRHQALYAAAQQMQRARKQTRELRREDAA